MFYLVSAPWWLRRLIYPEYRWSMPRQEKKIYLTFDDGPHPVATPFVLDALKAFNAKATFFCIGKNVTAHPALYRRILEEGHAVGNHTYDHLNGWKTADDLYMRNIEQARTFIDSHLFRPPYGRITRFQASLASSKFGLKVVMWSVLSGDFDVNITAEKCWSNVKKAAGKGSIIVFHDSEKAQERMTYALQQTLSHFSALGFSFEKLSA